jgi:hypothetical protein
MMLSPLSPPTIDWVCTGLQVVASRNIVGPMLIHPPLLRLINACPIALVLLGYWPHLNVSTEMNHLVATIQRLGICIPQLN